MYCSNHIANDAKLVKCYKYILNNNNNNKKLNYSSVNFYSQGNVHDAVVTTTITKKKKKDADLRMFVSFFCKCHNAKKSFVIHNFGSFNTLMKCTYKKYKHTHVTLINCKLIL